MDLQTMMTESNLLIIVPQEASTNTIKINIYIKICSYASDLAIINTSLEKTLNFAQFSIKTSDSLLLRSSDPLKY